MRVLDITIDLGPGASPVLVETMVKAVRVACDVGVDATLRQVRRAAEEQMKFPTNRELIDATERLPGSDESILSYRLRELLHDRTELAERLREVSLDPGWDLWYYGKKPFGMYRRLRDAAPLPSVGGPATGLDVVAPDLYNALVADRVAGLTPSGIVVRELRYHNPIGETVAAVGAGAEAITKAAGVIETVATMKSRKRVAQAQADVAEAQAKVAMAVADDQIESSQLDNDLKREQLRQLRLANDREAAEIEALCIANGQALAGLNSPQALRVAVEQLTLAGQLDEADAVAALEPADAAALLELAARAPVLALTEEPDPEEA